MRALFEDRWIPVGLDDQVKSETVHPVVVNQNGLAVWRSQNGTVQIWEDRCPHRGMRLSFGFVRGERLSCLYHGWQYETSGQCGHIPAHPDLVPPKTICVPSYAVRSHRGILFANLAEAPKASWPQADEPGWYSVRSIFVAVDVAMIRQYLGKADNALGAPARMVDLDLYEMDASAVGRVSLALQPIDAGRTAIHITSNAANADQRQQFARQAVRMRRELERK